MGKNLANGAGAIAFTDYHYYEDLASGANYVPTIASLSLLCNELRELKSGDLHIEFWDGGGWINGHPGTSLENTCHMFQDNSQNIRVYNANGAAQKISLTGIVLSGITDYHHYANLASHTAYTPSAKSITSFFNSYGYLDSDEMEIKFWDGAGWIQANSSTPQESSRLLLQDNDQNIQIYNDAAGAIKISLTGITWT